MIDSELQDSGQDEAFDHLLQDVIIEPSHACVSHIVDTEINGSSPDESLPSREKYEVL